jgi:hypothetical protein
MKKQTMTIDDYVEAMNQLSDRLFASSSELMKSGLPLDYAIAAALMKVSICINETIGEDDDRLSSQVLTPMGPR